MTSTNQITPTSSFISRFFYWSNDRFPFFNVIVAFVMAFSIKGIFIGQNAFDWRLADFLLGMLFLTLLFILRVMDEHKDFESDKSYHPDRAVQKGIIALKELRLLGILALAVQFICLFYLSKISSMTFLFWALVLIWSFLMLKEFFVKNWLRTHLFTYSILHLLISPFMFLTGWVFYSQTQSEFDFLKLAILMSLSLTTGLMFEVARKNRSAEEDAKGELSFSLIWGRKTSGLVLNFLSTAALILGGLYIQTGLVFMSFYFVIGTLLLIAIIKSHHDFNKNPNQIYYKKSRQLVELMVVWSFVASFLIVLVRSYL